MENKTYKPGDKVTGTVEIKNPSSTEVAIAVLDEAVFDLILKGREYFNPAKQLYSLDELNVGTFDNLLKIIGKREYKKKGANSGGDGLSSKDRETTKFVAYWNPSQKTNNEGKVSFTFDAPDNLTNWRVFAVALNETDKMGLGEGNFSVSKEIEIRPITPNQVIEDDTFKGEFTVLNRTDTEKEVNVSITASGTDIVSTQNSQKFLVKPFERKPFSLPVTAKSSGEIILKASAQSGNFSDSFIQKIPVHKKASLETAAIYGSFDADSQSNQIFFPQDITDILFVQLHYICNCLLISS